MSVDRGPFDLLMLNQCLLDACLYGSDSSSSEFVVRKKVRAFERDGQQEHGGCSNVYASHGECGKEVASRWSIMVSSVATNKNH